MEGHSHSHHHKSRKQNEGKVVREHRLQRSSMRAKKTLTTNLKVLKMLFER